MYASLDATRAILAYQTATDERLCDD